MSTKNTQQMSILDLAQCLIGQLICEVPYLGFMPEGLHITEAVVPYVWAIEQMRTAVQKIPYNFQPHGVYDQQLYAIWRQIDKSDFQMLCAYVHGGRGFLVTITSVHGFGPWEVLEGIGHVFAVSRQDNPKAWETTHITAAPKFPEGHPKNAETEKDGECWYVVTFPDQSTYDVLATCKEEAIDAAEYAADPEDRDLVLED
jgi:hypothetical protein